MQDHATIDHDPYSLERRSSSGLLVFFDGPGPLIAFSDETLAGDFTICVQLCSTREAMRGDIETRAVEIVGRKSRAAWQAAWSLARRFRRASPHTPVRVRRSELAMLRLYLPQYLADSYLLG